MRDDTPLEAAYRRMTTGDAEAAVAFCARLAAAHLIVVLEEPAGDTRFRPRLTVMEGADVISVYETDALLARSLQEAVETVTLPGRDAIEIFATGAAGLALNPVEGAEIPVIGPDMLTQMKAILPDLAHMAEESSATLLPPADLAAPLTEADYQAIGEAVTAMTGTVAEAWLVEARYRSGREELLLAVAPATPDLPEALKQGVAQAFYSAIAETGVPFAAAFFAEDDQILSRARQVGLGFKPETIAPKRPAPSHPGADPDKPPRLR